MKVLVLNICSVVKGYDYCYTIVFVFHQELAEPTKKLAEETGTKDEPESDMNQATDRDG